MKHASNLPALLTAIILGLSIVLVPAVQVRAVSPMAVPAGLSLAELKVTGDEFIMLQNNTANTISDLSVYWLNAFNNVTPLGAGVSSSTQQLPAASLQPRQTLLLSANPMQTCGASVAGKLSVSLSDGGGFLQLTRAGLSSEGAVVQTPGDYVSWSSGAAGIIPNIPSSSKNPRAVFYRYFNGDSYAWQVADLDALDSCQLNIVVAGAPGSSSAVTPLTLATTSPPATTLGIDQTGTGGSGAVLPAADIGLMAPQISELLPNPVGTGTDAKEEFIELYNPNAKAFDLTGFTLQTGLTTARNYTFPAGTMLAPNKFRAFYAGETKLGLSNTSGHAALLDPFENTISNSEVYTSAKDGISWAIASGKWRWTTQATPGGANIIKTPATKSKKTTKSTAKKKASVKGSRLTNISTSGTGSSDFEDEEAVSPVHTWVLALVAAVALLYGAYEYRRDITNRLYQLRTKLGSRRASREEAAGGRSD